MNSAKKVIKRTLRRLGYDLVQYPSRETYGEHIREPLRTLDIDSVLDVGAHNVFLKMDTQGWDLEVLRGADTCISRIGAVQSEVSLKAIYKGMPSFIEAITECNRLGLEITGMFPVTRNTNNLAVVEFDCVMTRHRPNTAASVVGVPRTTDPL